MKAMPKNYLEKVFKMLSSVTFKNHSEEDEFDPVSRLDSTCLMFVQKVALTDSIQSDTNHLTTTTIMQRKRLFANPSVYQKT